MANFGSSFSLGLRNGRVLKNDIEQERRRETEDKMFESAINFKKQELGAEGEEVAGMEAQRADIMSMFGKASVGDIAGSIVDNHVAGGGKINDQTYTMAMGVATKLFGIKKMEQDYQQKASLFSTKKQRFEAETSRLNRMNRDGVSQKQYAPSDVEKQYELYRKIDPKLAETYIRNKAQGKTKEEEQISAKDYNTGFNALIEMNPDLAGITDGNEKIKAVNYFKENGTVPEVEEYVVKEGMFFDDKSLRVKMGSKEEKKKTGKQPFSQKYDY